MATILKRVNFEAIRTKRAKNSGFRAKQAHISTHKEVYGLNLGFGEIFLRI